MGKIVFALMLVALSRAHYIGNTYSHVHWFKELLGSYLIFPISSKNKTGKHDINTTGIPSHNCILSVLKGLHRY